MHNSLLKVELIPENDTEKLAIKNIENMSANETERDIIENYLHYGLKLGDYSVLQSLNQKGNNFTLKISIL